MRQGVYDKFNSGVPGQNGGRTESFPFPFLSQGNFGEKPFREFLKAFPDLESDWQNLSCYF